MKYLLDTCLISELCKQVPDASVEQFYAETSKDDMYVSVLTLGELKKGILRLEASPKKQRLLYFYILVVEEHLSRILSLGMDVVDRWAVLLSSVQRTLPVIDSLLAATALHHDLTFVTRNERDFRDTGVRIHNPWSQEPQP